MELRVRKYRLPNRDKMSVKKLEDKTTSNEEDLNKSLEATTKDNESDAYESDVDSLDAPHCTICFMPLEDGDRVGDIVGCKHTFHADCLTTWVARRNACPLCQTPIARRRRLNSEELEELSRTDNGRPEVERQEDQSQQDI